MRKFAAAIGVFCALMLLLYAPRALAAAPASVAIVSDGEVVRAVEMNVGDECALDAVASPKGSYGFTTWRTGSARVVLVSSDGALTAVGEGSVYVTATVGGRAGGVKVTVRDPRKPRRVTIDLSDDTELDMGDTLALSATVEPSTAVTSITYTSSNASVAKVSKAGVVTPVKEGTVTITARTGGYPWKTDSVRVRVIDTKKPTAITLDRQGKITANLNEPFAVSWTLAPERAYSDVTFASSNPYAAKVSKDGTVTPIGEGTAIITARTRVYGVRASFTVKVVDPTKPASAAFALGKRAIFAPGDEATLMCNVLPETAVTGLTYSSSNAYVVKVDKNGNIQCLREGAATVYARTRLYNVYASINITVSDPKKPVSVAVYPDGAQVVNIGETLSLRAVVEPATAETKLTYTSSNKAVAAVSPEGVVTPLKEGTATITVKTDYMGRTAKMNVRVVDPTKPTGIAVDQGKTVTLRLADCARLSVTLAPAGAVSDVRWSSGMPNVVSVTQDGLIVGVTKGTATVVASARNNQKAYVTVKVVSDPLPEGVEIAGDANIELQAGQTRALAAKLLPEGAEGQITWSSSNANVASVSETGVVTALRGGVATITARSFRSGHAASVVVTVPAKAGEDALPLAGVRIGIDPGHQLRADTRLEPVAPGSSKTKMRCSYGTRGVFSGLQEHAVNLSVAMILRDKLTALGAEVFLTRESPYVNISNVERAVMMNRLSCDLVLRLHCNGDANAYANGIYVYAPRSNAVAAESQKAAAAVYAGLRACTGQTRGGVCASDTYSGLNWSEVPSILVEMGYMSNYAEDRKLADAAYQDLLAQGMADGARAYLGK